MLPLKVIFWKCPQQPNTQDTEQKDKDACGFFAVHNLISMQKAFREQSLTPSFDSEELVLGKIPEEQKGQLTMFPVLKDYYKTLSENAFEIQEENAYVPDIFESFLKISALLSQSSGSKNIKDTIRDSYGNDSKEKELKDMICYNYSSPIPCTLTPRDTEWISPSLPLSLSPSLRLSHEYSRHVWNTDQNMFLHMIKDLNDGKAIGYVPFLASEGAHGHWLAALLYIENSGNLVLEIADSLSTIPENDIEVSLRIPIQLWKLCTLLQYFYIISGPTFANFIQKEEPIGKGAGIEKQEGVAYRKTVNPYRFFVYPNIFVMILTAKSTETQAMLDMVETEEDKNGDSFRNLTKVVELIPKTITILKGIVEKSDSDVVVVSSRSAKILKKGASSAPTGDEGRAKPPGRHSLRALLFNSSKIGGLSPKLMVLKTIGDAKALSKVPETIREQLEKIDDNVYFPFYFYKNLNRQDFETKIVEWLQTVLFLATCTSTDNQFCNEVQNKYVSILEEAGVHLKDNTRRVQFPLEISACILTLISFSFFELILSEQEKHLLTQKVLKWAKKDAVMESRKHPQTLASSSMYQSWLFARGVEGKPTKELESEYRDTVTKFKDMKTEKLVELFETCNGVKLNIDSAQRSALQEKWRGTSKDDITAYLSAVQSIPRGAGSSSKVHEASVKAGANVRMQARRAVSLEPPVPSENMLTNRKSFEASISQSEDVFAYNPDASELTLVAPYAADNKEAAREAERLRQNAVSEAAQAFEAEQELEAFLSEEKAKRAAEAIEAERVRYKAEADRLLEEKHQADRAASKEKRAALEAAERAREEVKARKTAERLTAERSRKEAERLRLLKKITLPSRETAERENIIGVLPETQKLKPLEADLPKPLIKPLANASDLLVTAGGVFSKELNNARFKETEALYREPALESLKPQFERKGGKIVFMPSMEYVQANPDVNQVWIRPDDVFLPMCHEGVNRSQIMFLVLVGLLRKAGVPEKDIRVCRPHGAEGGFDPYNYTPKPKENLTEDNHYFYINGVDLPSTEPSQWLHRNFIDVFGVEKQSKPGQETCKNLGLKLNGDENDLSDAALATVKEHRLIMRTAMNQLLFSVSALKDLLRGNEEGRVIIFSFVRATSIFLRRLLEVNRDGDFSRIVIVSLPFPDVLPRTGGRDEIQAHFASTGVMLDRDVLSKKRHVEVYKFYSSFLRVVQ